ncbi:MAG: enoyl-CoA hydratase-related protein [Myxococcota bacterium]
MRTVRFERRPGPRGGDIGLVTLDRPEVRNAINAEMIEDLGRVLDEVASAGTFRALVLRGSGEEAFAAGADIAQLIERNAEDALRRINAALFRRLEDQPVPTIAAIRGYALGGGCELAMACDIRVAAADAKLGQPEVGLGIVPGAGAIQRLPALVGLGMAKELILSGRLVDADEAQRLGLVNRVVAAEALEQEAMALAERIAKQGPLAVRLSKLALNASARPNPAFETLDVLGQAVCFDSDDKRVRMQAFLDRKKNKESK